MLQKMDKGASGKAARAWPTRAKSASWAYWLLPDQLPAPAASTLQIGQALSAKEPFIRSPSSSRVNPPLPSLKLPLAC
jgi:hypothetical protein